MKKLIIKILVKIKKIITKLLLKLKFEEKLEKSTLALLAPYVKEMAETGKLAPYVKEMAETGKGTDACLEIGCLPMRVHFYSPVPDIKDLENRNIFEKRSALSGINFRVNEQIDFLLKLGREFGNECNWPLDKTSDPMQFYLRNGTFSFGCAAALYTMIRYNKPKKIIEIGSGSSSLIISDALKLNYANNKEYSCKYIIIDPYPGEIYNENNIKNLSKIVKERVELTNIVQFEQLENNDILFIDSSHVVKIGADVNFLILDVLPKLKKGVVIHFHDINFPYASPKVYYTNPVFRVFWTEEYLLQAFLEFNDTFEILLAMNYLQKEHMDKFCEAFTHFDLKTNWATSGSFWIRKKNNL